jgi:uncharacterized membrane protein YGL010W
MMRSIQEWLDEYAVSHQNSTNKVIHWICVPLIVWSIILLFLSIPEPLFLSNLNLNWAWIASGLAVIYYSLLSPALAIGMTIFLGTLNFFSLQVEITSSYPVWTIGLAIFVIAWIGQFFGHQIEGKKPSFLKDIQFLLIGPVWLMHFIYKKLGWKY